MAGLTPACFLGANNCATNYIRLHYPLTILCSLSPLIFLQCERTGSVSLGLVQPQGTKLDISCLSVSCRIHMDVMDLVASCIFLCPGTNNGISPWHPVVQNPLTHILERAVL